MDLELENWLKEYNPYIRLNVINISKICSKLRSANVISFGEGDQTSNPYFRLTKAQEWDILSMTLKKNNKRPSSLDILVGILKETDNEFIVEEINQGTLRHRENPAGPPKTFLENIQQNEDFLIYYLMNQDQVAIEMFNQKIIIFSKKETIVSLLINDQKSEVIVSCMLSATNIEDYRKFLKILRDTDNKACLEILQKVGNFEISEKMLSCAKEEREDIKADFRVQNHHCVSIALKLSEVPRLKDNWGLICEDILTPREIANLENEKNFETKIMRTIQAWVLRMGQDAYYNLLVEKIKLINQAAGVELDNIREEVSEGD